MNRREFDDQIAQAKALRSGKKPLSPASQVQFELDFADPIPSYGAIGPGPSSGIPQPCAALGAQREAVASVGAQGAGIAQRAPRGRKPQTSVPGTHDVSGVWLRRG